MEVEMVQEAEGQMKLKIDHTTIQLEGDPAEAQTIVTTTEEVPAESLM